MNLQNVPDVIRDKVFEAEQMSKDQWFSIITGWEPFTFQFWMAMTEKTEDEREAIFNDNRSELEEFAKGGRANQIHLVLMCLSAATYERMLSAFPPL